PVSARSTARPCCACARDWATGATASWTNPTEPQQRDPMDKNIRILIVDDFSTMRRIVKNLLNDIGLTNTTEADDGTTALVELKKASFDLVVTDWNMPGMAGIDL